MGALKSFSQNSSLDRRGYGTTRDLPKSQQQKSRILATYVDTRENDF